MWFSQEFYLAINVGVDENDQPSLTIPRAITFVAAGASAPTRTRSQQW
jgi:hypothetical protein